MNVVDIAWQIVEMKRTIDTQEQEIKRLKRVEVDYTALIRSSNKHNSIMATNVLNLCMAPAHAHLIEQLKSSTVQDSRLAGWRQSVRTRQHKEVRSKDTGEITMKRTTHILNWYLRHAKQASPPPLIFSNEEIARLCLLQRIEQILASNEFGLNPQPKEPTQ